MVSEPLVVAHSRADSGSLRRQAVAAGGTCQSDSNGQISRLHLMVHMARSGGYT